MKTKYSEFTGVFAFTLAFLGGSTAFAANSQMPPQKIRLGKRVLYCVVVNWTNANIGSETECANMANYVAAFYERNSNGQFTLEPHVGSVNTGIDGTASNTTVGENLAKQTYKADYYIIPNKFYGGDHAGSQIAHLGQILDTVATHEVGHLIGINHTTKLYGTPPLLDEESIMNPYARYSAYLTAPQYYYTGWLSSSEITEYDGTANTQYLLKHPLDETGAGDATVIVPPSLTPASRFAFISYPAVCNISESCVALHLPTVGGSQLVREIPIGSSYVDTTYTGLSIETKPGTTTETVEITVSAHQ